MVVLVVDRIPIIAGAVASTVPTRGGGGSSGSGGGGGGDEGMLQYGVLIWCVNMIVLD